MKVLLINGSPRHTGNTFIALSEVAGALEAEGVRTQIVQLGNKPVRGCIACGKCADLGRCVFDDPLYDEVRVALRDADGLVVGSPVYYAGPNGSLCALLDRVFYSCSELLAYKPAAAVVVCRRGGASAAFDRLNKYFTISNMLSSRRNLGTACTDGCPARRRRMPKDCRRCGCWDATWRGCSRPARSLRRRGPKRRSASGRILSGSPVAGTGGTGCGRLFSGWRRRSLRIFSRRPR